MYQNAVFTCKFETNDRKNLFAYPYYSIVVLIPRQFREAFKSATIVH